MASDYTGPCPKCGNLAKNKSKTLIDYIAFKDSLNWEKRREFFEGNRKIKWLIIAITFGWPIGGFFVGGLIGVAVGLALGFISYLLGPSAVIKVREIERGHSN
jgi:purine-cytosine permease-like protein